MTVWTRILLADDDATFREATAELLRNAGFACDTAADGYEARRLLKDGEYALVIADIRMPGNAELELVSELPAIAAGTPAILVTAYPSVGTATESLHLPVLAYLVKPFELEELLEWVRVGVERHRSFTALANLGRRLRGWEEELAELSRRVLQDVRLSRDTPIEAFLTLTMNNIIASLMDLKGLTEALCNDGDGVEQHACGVLNCPRQRMLNEALLETIRVLEKTKQSFKSKELGELRRKLELVVWNR